MNQSKSTGHQTYIDPISRHKSKCNKHQQYKNDHPSPASKLKNIVQTLMLFVSSSPSLLVSLSLSLSISTSLHAQIDHETIDWQALDSAFYKQYNPEISPKWLFPIIFEEGTGMRDTIYLGYHPDQFWDTITTFDTSYFNAFVGSSSFWEYNETRNAGIVPLNRENLNFGYINFHKAVYPLYMYWDVTRLRSDSLPFEDQHPAPRAEGQLNWSYIRPENESGNIEGCDMHIPVLITDTSWTNCVGRHFFVFDNHPWTDFDELHGFGFSVTKWLGYYDGLNLEKPAQGTTVLLYPNPSSGTLNIQYNQPGKYRVISPIGEVVTEGDIEAGKTILDLSNLHTGIYLFQLLNENYQVQYSEKLIVNP